LELAETAFDFTLIDGKITRIDAIADPERLRELDVVSVGS